MGNGLDGILGDLNLGKTEKKKSKSSEALSVLSLLSKSRETEVFLPVLNAKALIKPFNKAEDLYLQTLKVSGGMFHRYVDELLYEHAKFLDVGFSSFDDFIDNISPIDKGVMMIGLLRATFNELPERVITCPKCKKPDTYTFAPEAMIHNDTFTKVWDKDVEARHYTVTNELIPGFKITYGMPYEKLRLEVLEDVSSSEMRDNLQKHDDVLSLVDFMALYIRQLDITSDDGTVITLTDHKEDILPTIKNMPLDIQVKLIDDSTIDVFTEYNPYFYINVRCGQPDCQHEYKWEDIKPENDFFRKALSLYNS